MTISKNKPENKPENKSKTEQQNNPEETLLKFPCMFPIKIMGLNKPELKKYIETVFVDFFFKTDVPKKSARKNFGRKYLLVEKNFDRKNNFSIGHFFEFFDQYFFEHFFFSAHRFFDFFRRFFSTKKMDRLFRSQMFQRFQKSYLEQRAIILKIRTARTKKKFNFLYEY